jgi:hypothetical protein
MSAEYSALPKDELVASSASDEHSSVGHDGAYQSMVVYADYHQLADMKAAEKVDNDEDDVDENEDALQNKNVKLELEVCCSIVYEYKDEQIMKVLASALVKMKNGGIIPAVWNNLERLVIVLSVADFLPAKKLGAALNKGVDQLVVGNPPSKPGTCFLLKVLGHGSFGRVFMVCNKKGVVFAAKALLKRDQQLDGLERECQVWQKVYNNNNWQVSLKRFRPFSCLLMYHMTVQRGFRKRTRSLPKPLSIIW